VRGTTTHHAERCEEGGETKSEKVCRIHGVCVLQYYIGVTAWVWGVHADVSHTTLDT
jgi:hypothetical protein